jgi:O-antigen biosynthesis protein
MQEKDISIVIVNYNVKDFLLQCLKSIKQASVGLSVQVIVVDNNSSDGSVDYLEPLFPGVEFIRTPKNLGFAKANNTGFEKAYGKYVLILNPDTILAENTLKVMYDYMENHQEVGISGCKVLNPDGTFQMACRRGFPTPWASFSKLFGLQKLFPKSRLFAQYNQTYKSIDETYYIDALIGAFMFARKSVIDETGGFDTAFFMYGEDLDLCYRASKSGWKIAYVHETSIIHYKGESTKRSSINELKHFYEAMVIFTSKHYSGSGFFLLFLKLGILFRAGIAQLSAYLSSLIFIIFDVLALNGSLLLATKQKFGAFFAFPEYAYPTVFIAASITLVLSMIAAGEYFDVKHTIRKSFFGLMLSFLVLSSLTYYFKEYAFSREVLIMTIVFTSILVFISRVAVSGLKKYQERLTFSRIAIVGNYDDSEKLINYIRNSSSVNSEIVGIINTGKDVITGGNLPVLGNIDYINKIIDDNLINEILITDNNINSNDIVKFVAAQPKKPVRYHIAQQFDDFIFSRIVSEISGIEPTIPEVSISRLRFRIIKRLLDIFLAIVSLTIGMPFLLMRNKSNKSYFKKLWLVFIGKYSFIGIYKFDGYEHDFGKEGIIGLAHLGSPASLTPEAISKLNDYYLINYSLSLDMDIILKFIFRKKRGNKIHS